MARGRTKREGDTYVRRMHSSRTSTSSANLRTTAFGGDERVPLLGRMSSSAGDVLLINSSLLRAHSDACFRKHAWVWLHSSGSV